MAANRLILDTDEMEPWGEVACRVFVTDRLGFQVSDNYEREGSSWRVNPRGFGRYRSFRPYFPGPTESGTGLGRSARPTTMSTTAL